MTKDAEIANAARYYVYALETWERIMQDENERRAREAKGESGMSWIIEAHGRLATLRELVHAAPYLTEHWKEEPDEAS